MISYLTSMDNISLSRTVFEIYDFEIFRVWPLTPKGHLGSKKYIPFESPYMTSSYLTSKDTVSLSRTVSEIFYFIVFGIRPLTPKGHPGSKNFILFESPYRTSYLTSMDNISLSRTVSEIFDFKVFRVWPWPLTPKRHLRSKKLYCSKAHIWLPIWLPWTTSLYLVPFQRYSTSKFLGFDLDLWPLKVIWGRKKIIPFESPYMTSYLTSMDNISLSRTVLEIMPVKILKADQNGGFWPFKGQGQVSIFFCHRKGTSSHQTASFEILRIKIGSAVGCTHVKERKKFKKKKKAQNLICCVYVPQSLKIFPKPNFARLFRSMT